MPLAISSPSEAKCGLIWTSFYTNFTLEITRPKDKLNKLENY